MVNILLFLAFLVSCSLVVQDIPKEPPKVIRKVPAQPQSHQEVEEQEKKPQVPQPPRG